MAYTVTYLTDYHLIEIDYKDILQKKELHQALAESGELAFKHNTFTFLADCTQLEGGHSVFDLYEIIATLDKMNVTHRMKEAILFNNDAPIMSNVVFFETTARNRGFNVRIFADREKALSWLTS